MRRASLTLRLALLFAASASVVLVSVALLVRMAVERHFSEQDLAEISGKVELIGELLARNPDAASSPAFVRRLDEALIGHHGLAVQVAIGGRTIYASAVHDHGGGAPFANAPAPTAGGRLDVPALKVWPAGATQYRGVSRPLPVGGDAGSMATVGVALDIAHHRSFMHELDRSLGAAVLVGALTLALCGWWAARRGLAPVRAMAHVAHGISASRLTTRLDIANVPTELHELAQAFNDMLGRLEDSFRRLSDFSADLAHELRTPVSNLMTQTQVALSKPRSAPEYAEILHSNLEEYERLARMIGDMLFLAKADHGLVIPQRETIRLGDEVRQLFEFYDALAEDRGVRLRLDGEATLSGDRLMLRRALANLLANALRYAPAGGEIVVGIARAGDAVRLSVANAGPPIPPELLARIFDRFVRGDPARHTSGEGAGLGLAITRSIVEAHGGRIDARSDAESTRFVVDLPVKA